MAKRKKIKHEIKTPSKSKSKDTVVFMTAYDIHKIKQHFFRFGRKNKRKELWAQCHIAGISYNCAYITPYAKCHYRPEYNSQNQIVSFHFEEDFEKINTIHERFADEMITTLCLHHSAEALLDSTLIKVDTCYNMERFLVTFSDKVYQVDPLAFVMNGSLIVCFELIDFETAVPLNHKSIFGRNNNYGIKQAEKIKYFGESEFRECGQKISDIIFDSVYGFLTKASNDKWEIGNYSFVHNTLVLSNNVENVAEYFQTVLGGKIDNFSPHNISATDLFRLYSTEYLGLITNIVDAQDYHRLLNDCIMLEAFKTYILLEMVMDYEIHDKIDEIIDHQIYVQSQMYPLHVPIITLNMIDNLKTTYSFSRYKQAVDFKLQALKIYQDRKISSNGRLLNILLYILAMLGSAQTLQVLKLEFGLPFNISFWVVMGMFVLLGIVWLIREQRKK